jgi:hypothetical protein
MTYGTLRKLALRLGSGFAAIPGIEPVIGENRRLQTRVNRVHLVIVTVVRGRDGIGPGAVRCRSRSPANRVPTPSAVASLQYILTPPTPFCAYPATVNVFAGPQVTDEGFTQAMLTDNSNTRTSRYIEDWLSETIRSRNRSR